MLLQRVEGLALQGADIFVVCVLESEVWEWLGRPTFLSPWQIYSRVFSALVLHECEKETESKGV